MNMNFPKKVSLANLPTSIEKLKLSNQFKNIDVYIKRDDQTGFELSGNKVRKLEYIMEDVIKSGCDCIITCGGIQSNHVRATAATAAKFGIKCIALLKGEHENPISNYYMDMAFGAEIIFISDDEYKNNRTLIMDELKIKYEKDSYKVYLIPEGASNGLGNLGYFDAYKEIIEQEKKLDLVFDILSVAVGSCGTYAGLYLGDLYYKKGKNILGINIYDSKVDYKEKTQVLIESSSKYFDEEIVLENEINIVSDYVGEGYGKTSDDVFSFMREFSKSEGILIDRVYTGKGFYGFMNELRKIDLAIENTDKKHLNALFIHTGGTFVFDTNY